MSADAPLSPPLDTDRDLRKSAALEVLAQIVTPLAAVLPQPCEVVLHDLDRLPDSIVAIAGDVTGRAVGGAATDMLLEAVARGDLRTHVGYRSTLADGTSLRCSTIVVAVSGVPAAALCVNLDGRHWENARDAVERLSRSLDFLTPGTPEEEAVPTSLDYLAPQPTESFPRGVDELAETLVRRAIERVGVPVSLMKKSHKMQVCAELDDSGYFLIRESVESLAAALGVTRFTIYNYLNDLRGSAN